MANAKIPDLSREYSGWLRDRIRGIEIGDSTLLVTPFLDPFHDGIEIFAERKNGEFLLHDDGETYDNLLSLGVKIEDSDRRMALIHRSIHGCGVQFQAGRLEIHATASNLPQRVHFLLTSILRLNDLWMSLVPHRASDFAAMVAEFLDAQNVTYMRDISIPGKTVEHLIDFAIAFPKQRERLIKVVGDPSPQMAKIVSFTWFDLQEARPQAERVSIVNDVRIPDPFSESLAEFKKVSDQTLAILGGYSNAIYRWSQHDQLAFQKLWLNGSSHQNIRHAA